MAQITLLFFTLSLLLNLVATIALPGSHHDGRSSHSAIARSLEPRSGQKMTYFYPGLGACGWKNSNLDYIIAIPGAEYDHGKHCGKHVMIKDPETGKALEVQVADECPAPYCASTHIDVSPAVFRYFAPESEGVRKIEWWYID